MSRLPTFPSRPLPLTPPTARLQRPSNTFGLGMQAVQKADIAAMAARHQVMSRNVSRFRAIAAEGHLLSDALSVANTRSFMDQALHRIARDAGFRNMFTGLLSNTHTHLHLVRGSLGWMGFYCDVFTSVPIAANIADNAIAHGSLEALKELAGDPETIFAKVRKGVLTPALQDGAMLAEPLRIQVKADGQDVMARQISAKSSTIVHEGKTYYNGLPGDRGAYPSVILAPGSHFSVEVTNTSPLRHYAIVPSINGMPLMLQSMGFLLNGFEHSPFPLQSIDPHMVYLRPGETRTFTHFKVDSTGISDSATDSGSHHFISDYSAGMTALTPLLIDEFLRLLSDDDRKLLEEGELAEPSDRALRDAFVYEQAKRYGIEFLQFLRQVRQCDLVMGRPVIADAGISAQLDNPMLGTFGMTILEASRPPVTARHTLSWESTTKMGGGIGLATIGGGADDAGLREANNFDYHSWNHTYAGHLTANLLSTTTPA